MTDKVIISDISEEGDVYKFTLSKINLSYGNAIRRTILSEIPVCVIRTEDESVNQCKIEINTGKLTNEILKHRLSCIPIHLKEVDLLPDNYELELDVTNNTDSLMYVTTEQFRIRNKANGNYLTTKQTSEIFPPNKLTNQYIDFTKLQPKRSEMIPGERIKLTADFSISNAKVNSMFNVVSKCTYSNTMDREAGKKKWDEHKAILESKQTSVEDIKFEGVNFQLLDAQRYYVDNSFDFTIQTLGIYSNLEIIHETCKVLNKKFQDLIDAIETDIVPIHISETTMDNCWNIVLENEDYTIGKILEYILYEHFYKKDKSLSFCGFRKLHPHNTESIIRIAYTQSGDRNKVRHYMKHACEEAIKVITQISRLF